MPVAGFAAVVAVLAAYLGDCLPGFGSGGSADGQTENSNAEQKKSAEPAEQSNNAPASRISIAVVGERCTVTGGEAQTCADACAALTATEGAKVEIDAAKGTHGAVENLRECLTKAGFSDVRVLAP